MSQVYPDTPGWKGGPTSEAAANAIAPKAGTLRERVAHAIAKMPGTPEEIARQMQVDLFSIRPRFSELKEMGVIQDSGQRRKSRSGRSAIVWEAAAS